MRLRCLQFNTLGRHLAEVVQFPYAVDVTAERNAGRSARYEDWDAYHAPAWLRESLDTTGTSPAEYILGQDEGGTFTVEEAATGALVYSWSERFPQLVRQITAHIADIIFLQEVELGTLPDFAHALDATVQVLSSAGVPRELVVAPTSGTEPAMRGVFAPRKDALTSDGIALLWRTSRLQPAGLPRLLRFRDNQKLALMQTLEATNEANGRPLRLLAVTTHLHWNPAAPLQGREVTELIEVLSQGQGAILLGADLNCGRQNDCFKQLCDAGFADVDALSSPSHRKRFTMHVPRAPVPKLTDARQWADHEVTRQHPVESDYVLTRGLDVTGVQVLDTGACHFVPARDNGLPHREWSASDHFPLAYELEFCVAEGDAP